MIVEHKDNLRELTFVVLENSKDLDKSLVQVHASRSSLLGISDFAEYGLKFIPSKYKFNSDPAINYLSEKSREVVGPSIDDLEKVEGTFFPTGSKVSKEELYGYFGSIDINNQTLTMINIPSGYDTVYLYDSYPDLTELELETVGGLRSFVLRSTWKVCIGLDNGEAQSKKLLWLVLSEDGKVSNINLSHLMWSGSDNPERNLCQYLLRNDKKKEIDHKVDIVGSLGGTDIVVDKNSDTILGNKKINKHPILSSLLGRFNHLNRYEPRRVYKEGSIIEYNTDSLYVALKDTSDPPVSNKPRLALKLIWAPLKRDKDINYDPTKCYETGSEVRYEGKSWVLTKNAQVVVGGQTYTSLLRQKTPSPPSIDGGWMEIVSTVYNPAFSYSMLSRCKYDGYYWVSLVDNNIGNIPGISCDKWILEGRLKDYHKKKISVVVTPGDGGTILEQDFEIQDGQRTLSIPVKLGNYCIDYITFADRHNYEKEVRLYEGDNKLVNNFIVNGSSSMSGRSGLLDNYRLSGSYFDGSLVINLDLESSAGYHGIGSEEEWKAIQFTAPDGFELLSADTNTPSVMEVLESSNYLINVVLKRNSVVPVVNLKINGTKPRSMYDNDFYTKFRHPLDTTMFDTIRKNYKSLDPSGYSFGLMMVDDKPVGYDGNFMDSSGNSTGENAFVVETGNNFSFKLLVDPNKYEFGSIASNYYDPYESESSILPKTGEFIKRRLSTEKFSDLEFTSLYVDDLIEKNAFPIYTVELNSRVYTINIAKFDGFEVSSYSESTNYGGSVKFTIASEQHKVPKIKILKDDDTDLLSGGTLSPTPTQNRFYIPDTTVPYVSLNSYLIKGAVDDNNKPIPGSDYTGTPGISKYGSLAEKNLTGKHDIIISFEHPAGSASIYEGNYKIFIGYDNK